MHAPSKNDKIRAYPKKVAEFAIRFGFPDTSGKIGKRLCVLDGAAGVFTANSVAFRGKTVRILNFETVGLKDRAGNGERPPGEIEVVEEQEK